ncbi:maleylpyruvate isomerase family mycothiol-dependent enzyme [[Mycobacterium] nativiensis]|uniref:Maleylpyruvate isomerase family mycothiol-dependent enzyme n=1 Tax=[Mycobacterium] nativiensis TaxID=2855503 RepID=A0ABU5XT56_9MYCO|nr:maleylpyruvate isomerase family mycothiol-dependent enzyme [Mycolicibacter sp. MYC340]MEB3031120.1 maleylpyruvate isomerase family mycothiol-dependent enzyme [Mycolicibacter sp. MYC340]
MDYAAALLDETRALGELIRTSDPALPIPTCPEWNLTQLFRHVGRGHRWAAQIVADRLDRALDPRDVVDGKPPADPGAAIDWLNDGAQLVLDAVAQVGPDNPAWTFLGPRPAIWWVRRRLHEATVHRADVVLALGGEFTLAAELAGDGIGEWLDLVTARLGRDGQPLPLSDGESVHLHATDDGLGPQGEWTISRSAGADTVSWAHEHGKGSVALRGPARDLFLAVMRRVPVADTDIAVFGDAAVWQNWVDHTAF